MQSVLSIPISELTAECRYITISVDVRLTNFTKGSIRFGASIRNKNNDIINALNSKQFAYTEFSDGVWTRIKDLTITLDGEVGTKMLMLGYIYNANEGATLEYKNIMIEAGNKSSGWIPALEDNLDTKITTGTEFATDEYIDNKRVYRKRVNFGALPNATSKIVAHGLSNIRIVRATGCAISADNGCIILPYSHPTVANNISLSLNNVNIQIVTGMDRSAYTGYVDLYYTKN